jgi:hypothetical protein
MRSILLNNVNKHPTSLKEIKDALGKQHMNSAGPCLKKATHRFKVLFGYELVELQHKEKDIAKFEDELLKHNNAPTFRHVVSGHQRMFVLRHFFEEDRETAKDLVVEVPGEENECDHAARGFLFLVLGFILLQDGSLQDDQLWNYMKQLNLPANMTMHKQLGSVKHLVDNVWVKQQYLEKRKPVDFNLSGDKVKHVYQWGPRAHRETTPKQVFQWLAGAIMGQAEEDMNPLVVQGFEKIEHDRAEMLNTLSTCVNMTVKKKKKKSAK